MVVPFFQSLYSRRFQFEPSHLPPAANGNWDRGQGASASMPPTTANNLKQKLLVFWASSSFLFPHNLSGDFRLLSYCIKKKQVFLSFTYQMFKMGSGRDILAQGTFQEAADS